MLFEWAFYIRYIYIYFSMSIMETLELDKMRQFGFSRCGPFAKDRDQRHFVVVVMLLWVLRRTPLRCNGLPALCSCQVIFFELLTKQLPFSEISAAQLPAAKAAGQLPSIPPKASVFLFSFALFFSPVAAGIEVGSWCHRWPFTIGWLTIRGDTPKRTTNRYLMVFGTKSTPTSLVDVSSCLFIIVILI